MAPRKSRAARRAKSGRPPTLKGVPTSSSDIVTIMQAVSGAPSPEYPSRTSMSTATSAGSETPTAVPGNRRRRAASSDKANEGKKQPMATSELPHPTALSSTSTTTSQAVIGSLSSAIPAAATLAPRYILLPLPPGGIIGLVIGLLFLVAIIAFVSWLAYKKYKL
ncbi:hypothetical protein TWF281_002837 [Arthrobotrys megalospora]